ncbi:MAG: hypothetical protein BM555_04720 [Crocinitomix sp. MedPE-SWsnd]|nr:MAG: hypothetical protein BM555_04720 [Crocinitomix sp. MedPE-SWsnd]
MTETKICRNENCDKTVEGRRDRQFCSDYCKSEHHYSARKKTGKTYFKLEVDEVLRKNRAILAKHNVKSKATVRKSVLIEEGFNSRVFTHYWKNKAGDTYLFCYDQGFKEVKDNHKDKYLLIMWQAYMAQQVF